MENAVTVIHTSLQLQEGVYKVDGTFSSQTAKHSSNQRATKASFVRVTAARPPSSPTAKSKTRLSFAKRSAPPPAPPPAPAAGGSGGSGDGDGGPGAEYVALAAGDALCVVNLATLQSDATQREKRLASDPSCCSINARTSSLDNLDILVGQENGEVLLIEGLTMTVRGRFNVGGVLNPPRVTDVKWVPGSPTQFVAAFANGVLLVFDKDKEDSSSKSSSGSIDGSERGEFGVSILHPKASKNNPLARWLVGRGPVNHIAFSADGKMALSCHDGHARVFDFATERLLISFRSQYGAMLCSAWSPDNVYLVTGGEDDLVMVWNVRDRCPVARCHGHNSWISAVSFDTHMCELDADAVPGVVSGANYRFVSVAQDGRACVWDLNEGNLVVSRKRAAHACRIPLGSPGVPARAGQAPVAEAGRDGDCPHMEALANAVIDPEPLSNVVTTPSGLVTISFTGLVKRWVRPPPPSEDPPIGIA